MKISKELQQHVRRAVDDAISHCESNVWPDMRRAAEFYDGKTDVAEVKGRSKAVATVVRDAVGGALPPLLKTFLQSDKAVQFASRQPGNPQQVAFAERQTAYVNAKLDKLGRYRIFHGAVRDALIRAAGIVRVSFAEEQLASVTSYKGLTEEEAVALAMGDHVADELVANADGTFDIKSRKVRKEAGLEIDLVNPEDFFFDGKAKRLEDARCCGFRFDKMVGELVAMGFDFDTVRNLAEEEGNDDSEAIDDGTRNVKCALAYVMVSGKDNVPQLTEFLVAGDNWKVLDKREVNRVPFAVFSVSPNPHQVIGESLASLVMSDQNLATSLTRAAVDSMASANNPDMWAITSNVDPEALTRRSIGRIIGVKSPNDVGLLPKPDVAQHALALIEWSRDAVERKTGITDASTGLDPQAFVSATATAVQTATQAAASRVDLMARNLAESGMVPLMKLILHTLAEHPDGGDEGEFADVDQAGIDTDMLVAVFVGIGADRTQERVAALTSLIPLQQQAMQAGLLPFRFMRETLAELLSMAGVDNADRFLPPAEQVEQAMQQQQQAAAQQQGGGADSQAYVQAEMIKAQSRAQTDAGKLQLDAQRLAMEDDRERDRMAQDLWVKQAELQGRINVDAIRAAQQQPRGAQ